MTTFARRRSQPFCDGYLRVLTEVSAEFEHTPSYNFVFGRASYEAAHHEAEAVFGYTASEVVASLGASQAWADILSFCQETKIGWSRDLFYSWLSLRKQIAQAHVQGAR